MSTQNKSTGFPGYTNKGYYRILGLRMTATDAQVRSAYLSRIKANHPDGFQDPDQKLKQNAFTARLNEAYAVLSDTASRAEYDEEIRSYRLGSKEDKNLSYRTFGLIEGLFPSIIDMDDYVDGYGEGSLMRLTKSVAVRGLVDSYPDSWLIPIVAWVSDMLQIILYPLMFWNKRVKYQLLVQLIVAFLFTVLYFTVSWPKYQASISFLLALGVALVVRYLILPFTFRTNQASIYDH